MSCDAGTFSNQEGSPACTPCPSGKINAEKRSTSVDACADCPENTIPNKAQSDCIDPNALKGIGGVPILRQQKTESSIYKYKIRMNNELEKSETVTVTISSNDPRCTLRKKTVTFSNSNWNIDVDISIKIKDDNLFLAKDSTSYTCRVTNTLKSSIGTEYANRILTLDVTSSGCGEGEYLGEYDRGKDQTNCICLQTYYMPRQNKMDCAKCPSETSVCEEIGMLVPKTAKGFWRADMQSSNISEYPFYKCLPNQCMGTANTFNATCAKGYDQKSPKCSTCATHYIMTNGICVDCPSRNETSSATGSLIVLVVVCMLLYVLSGCLYLSRPALSEEIKGRVTRGLSNMDLFRSSFSRDNNDEIDRKSFSQIINTLDNELNLTPREAALVFDSVDQDGSGTITMEELHLYATEHKPTPLKAQKKSFGEKKTEMEDDSGWSGREDIAEQKDLIEQYKQTIVVPSIPFKEFPGITLPFNVGTDFQLPSFNLIEFPGININNVMNIQSLKLPSIDLCDFPNIVLPGNMRIQGNIKLPEILLCDYPNFTLPELPKISNKFSKLSKLNIPSMPNINMDLIHVPKINLNIGGSLMKIKLFLGFTQCVSFFPITFATVPFPTQFLNIGNFLQIFNVDLFALFGSSACDFGTGFYESFMFSFLLFPLVIGGALISYGAVRLRRKLSPSSVNYTTESARTRLYTFLFMIVYSLYTGVATKMFLLFKCEEIQGTAYLVADYRIVCYDETYNFYRNLAVLGITVYVFGILLGILGLLFYNKKYLHESTTPSDEMYKHLTMVKQFGSIYGDYTEENFYFDLADLARRLLLTGGLILVGEQSNTQIFLGALLCLIWLMLVTVRRPYEAYWDNVLSIVLSLQLLLIMLCGMALEMNRLTPKEKESDVVEKKSFGLLMVAFSIFIVITAIVAIVITIPCLRDRIVKIYLAKCISKDDADKDESEIMHTMPRRMRNVKPVATKKKQRRLSSRDLLKQQEEIAKSSEIEMTAVPIGRDQDIESEDGGGGDGAGNGNNNKFSGLSHWNNIRTNVKVGRGFKNAGQKERTRRLSQVLKARRQSNTLGTKVVTEVVVKKDGVSTP